MNKILILPELYDKVSAGWPFAVIKKIYDADLNKNFYYIHNWWSLELWNISDDTLKRKILNVIKFFLSKISSFPIFLNIIKILIVDYIKLWKLNLYNYKFIISHDILKSYLILRFYKEDKLINVYHWQWSMYTEYCDLGWYKKNFFIKVILNHIEKYVYTNAYKIWFPSYWTYEALIKTHSELKNIIEKRNLEINILYNSIDFNIELTNNNNLEKYLINDWYNFITISSIVYAKWVDRIPEFLKWLKDKWIKFKWIVVWRRNSYSDKLKENIKKFNIQNETYLHENWVPKSDIYWLLSKSDFYIMFHRYSIFDLATLEAMYFGNIPILSNVWWNKEVILENNWLLLDEDNLYDVDKFIKFLENNNKDNLSNLNKEIIKNNFNGSRVVD